MDCLYARRYIYSLRYRKVVHSGPSGLLCTETLIELRLLLLLLGATHHQSIEWIRACRALRLIRLHALHVHASVHAHASHGLLAHLHTHRLEASWLLLLLLLSRLLLLLLHHGAEWV